MKEWPNSSALNVFLLLKYFKRTRRWLKKKISVKRLYKRKRLLIRGKR
jgi:hypothetical protein